MKLVVVGAGYVGLVSGVCLAAKGHEVVCVDVNPQVVRRLNEGEPTIHEVGLLELLREVRANGRFSASASLSEAMEGAHVAIIAVGTPSEDGVIDLGYVRAAAREIGDYISHRDEHVSIIVKSTVTPGTTDTVVRQEIEAASGKRHPEFGLGMNPEFLREGEAIEDFMEPDRIVFGYEDAETRKRLHELYAPWAVEKCECNTRTAEMIKYANNCLLATQISAVNELANLAAAVGGIDMMDVMSGVHLDRRWNPILGSGRVNPTILSYLVPGCGFGGSCFPKDVQALRSHGAGHGLPMYILNAVLSVNEAQPAQVTSILSKSIGALAGRRILLLGLAFKPATDDVRESASLKIASDLLLHDADVVAHDPVANDNFRTAFGPEMSRIAFVEDWVSAVENAEAIIVATRWEEYGKLAEMDLAGKTVFDARRMLSKREVAPARYLGIGNRDVEAGAGV